MKSCNPMWSSLSGRIFLMVLAIIYTFCVGPANAASEPGAITIILDGEPMDLDPGNITKKVEGQVLTRNIMETLTELRHEDSSIVPRLATSWKQVDQNTWHFFLRKGVKFHDGEDFNAGTVVSTFKRIYDKRIPSATRVRFFANLNVTATALDSYTLELKTDKPEPLMPTSLSSVAICSPNTPMDKIIRNPIGTGPYKLVKWDAGIQIVAERFDGYWGKQPQVKKVTYLWRTESSVRAAMVLIGEADLAPEIAVQDANRPDLDYGYLNSETSSFRIGGLWEPPLNDIRVRMALNLAINRDSFRGSILSKDVMPATQLVVSNIFGFNPDLKPWPYDPAKARQLLAEARKDGVPVDREITLVGRIGIHPGGEELIEAVLTMYRAVGLNVKLRMLEYGAQLAYQNKPYNKDLGPYLLQKMHDNNKGDMAFTALQYHCKGNTSSACDKIADDLMDKAAVATGEERKKLWQAAMKRIHEEVIPIVPLFYMVAYTRIGKRINFRPSIGTSSEIQVAQITFK